MPVKTKQTAGSEMPRPGRQVSARACQVRSSIAGMGTSADSAFRPAAVDEPAGGRDVPVAASGMAEDGQVAP